MKKFLTSVLYALTFTLGLSAQNYIYHGDNQYESTSSWKFELNGNFWKGDPEITIAKHSNGGYLMLSIEVPFKTHYIGGAVIIFLNDGSIIKCTDKGIRDHVDNKSIVLYNFTKEEIEKLKQYPISKIRFSIKGGMGGSEAFTADNINEMIFSRIGNHAPKDYHETDKAVKKLFD